MKIKIIVGLLFMTLLTGCLHKSGGHRHHARSSSSTVIINQDHKGRGFRPGAGKGHRGGGSSHKGSRPPSSSHGRR